MCVSVICYINYLYHFFSLQNTKKCFTMKIFYSKLIGKVILKIL